MKKIVNKRQGKIQCSEGEILPSSFLHVTDDCATALSIFFSKKEIDIVDLEEAHVEIVEKLKEEFPLAVKSVGRPRKVK